MCGVHGGLDDLILFVLPYRVGEIRHSDMTFDAILTLTP